ncbi:spore germination protein [Cohnella nanjingensis]
MPLFRRHSSKQKIHSVKAPVPFMEEHKDTKISGIGTNLSLIRYRLQSPELRIGRMEIGHKTRSKVAICYMQGLTNPELIDEVNKRLSENDVDAILDSGYLDQYIEDNQMSPFPQVQYTERPDKVVANLLEGRRHESQLSERPSAKR